MQRAGGARSNILFKSEWSMRTFGLSADADPDLDFFDADNGASASAFFPLRLGGIVGGARSRMDDDQSAAARKRARATPQDYCELPTHG